MTVSAVNHPMKCNGNAVPWPIAGGTFLPEREGGNSPVLDLISKERRIDGSVYRIEKVRAGRNDLIKNPYGGRAPRKIPSLMARTLSRRPKRRTAIPIRTIIWYRLQ